MTTVVLAAAFFATSLALTIIASRQSGPTSIFDQTTGGPVQGGGGSLPGLTLPKVPAPSGTPATQAPPAPQAPQSK